MNKWMLGAALVAAGACSTPERPRAAEAPAVEATTEVVREDDVDELHLASGTVRARNTAVLSPRVAGAVRSLRARPGDRVAAGQLLAVIEAADVAAAAHRARAGLEEALAARRQAEAGVRAARASAGIAETTLGRVEVLAGERATTAQQLDEARARKDGASAQAAEAEAALRRSDQRIAQARAEVAGAETQLGWTRITAPFAGRVLERRVDLGNLVAPGVPVYVIEQEGPLRVEAAVDESLGDRVEVGDPAEVRLGDGVTIEGRIGEVVPAVDPASRAFLVKVDLPAGAPALRPGMFARVGLRTGRSGRLEVPAAALSRLGQLDRVWVVEEGRARLRLVTLGQRRGERVEVLSGVDPGETVIAAVVPGLRDGARVTGGAR